MACSADVVLQGGVLLARTVKRAVEGALTLKPVEPLGSFELHKAGITAICDRCPGARQDLRLLQGEEGIVPVEGQPVAERGPL
jgi:hypothetical protein